MRHSFSCLFFSFFVLSVDLCSYLNLKLVFRFSCCSWFLPKPAEEPHFSQRRRRCSHWMQTQDVSSRHDLLAQRQRCPPRKQQVTPLSLSDAISHIYGSFPSISGSLPNVIKAELFQPDAGTSTGLWDDEPTILRLCSRSGFWYNVFVKSFLLFTATQHCHWLWPFISACGIPLQQPEKKHVSACLC